MKIINSNKILNDNYFSFGRSAVDLTLPQSEIISENSIGISYLFSEKSEFEFKNFIRYFLRSHIYKKELENLYLVFSDRFIEKKNRIRSYQKLFHQEHDSIGAENFKELEIDLQANKSIMLGIIKVTENNYAYCMQRLFASIFTFGFSSIEQCHNLFSDKALLTIKEDFLEIFDLRYFNPLKAYLGLRGASNMVFQLHLHENNNQSLDLLMEKDLEQYYLNLGKEYLKEQKIVVYN